MSSTTYPTKSLPNITELPGYEDSTFTPVADYETSTGDLSVTYNTRIGIYEVNGVWVKFSIYLDIDLESTNASGNFIITGLPHAAVAGGIGFTAPVEMNSANTTYPAGRSVVVARIIQGQSFMRFYGTGSLVAAAPLSDSNIPYGAPLSAVNHKIGITGIYKKA